MMKAMKHVTELTMIAVIVAALLSTILPQRAEAGGPYQTYTCEPCRLLDTRFGSGDASGGAPYRIEPDETISIDVTETFISGQGGANDCGVPFPEAKGVFINVVAVQPSGSVQLANPRGNYITVYPFMSDKPTAASITYNPDDWAVSNGIFVQLCDSDVSTCDDDLSIYNGTGAYVDMVIDVTGWVQ